MPKYSEQTLTAWTYPASDSEESKLANAERLIKLAINSNAKLKNISYNIFGQGSYANDTNVRLNSDIDINVMYTDAFYYDLPNGKSKEDFGLTNPVQYSFENYKDDVEAALVEYFGQQYIRRNNKCITVLASTTRVQTDVVPTWKYRLYYENKSYVEGVYFISDEGTNTTSYPKQHIENGKKKNANTKKRFKRLTRILKKIRYKMEEDKIAFSPNISSFLIECLVWNVPDTVFSGYDSWTSRLKEAIRYLYHKTLKDEDCKDWGEVSELLYLFHFFRKWSRTDVNQFLLAAWQYMDFKD